jgi:hypothetical protein
MKCPNCDTHLCSGCGTLLQIFNTATRLCDDHEGHLCHECAWDLVDEENCMDCVRIREEENEDSEYEDTH